MLSGGCFCGEMRYEVDVAEASNASVCHCENCRRTTGAPMVAWFSVKPEAFRFTAGAPSRFASTQTGLREFCGRCGAQLTFRDARRDDEIDVTTASLDDPSAVPPVEQIWTISRLDWVGGVPALPELPRGHYTPPAPL